MRVHIAQQKHANCFHVFLGSSFLPQSTMLMRNQHDCDAMIIMLQWKEPENWISFLKKERQSYNMAKTIIRLYTQV